MTRLRIFDPPMCCSTGVCGPSVDPALAQFAADLDWLSRQGVPVERFNLSQEPGAFASDRIVKAELAAGGTSVLPLVLADEQVVARGNHPTRSELAAAAGLSTDATPKPAGLPVMSTGCCGSGCC